jgi:hypothetical protein
MNNEKGPGVRGRGPGHCQLTINNVGRHCVSWIYKLTRFDGYIVLRKV